MTPSQITLNKALNAQLSERMGGITAQNANSDGKLFETALTTMLEMYVDNMPVPAGKQPAKILHNRISDFMYGTDLAIDDPDCLFSGFKGITRIDITTNMTGKDNVPLMTPSFGMKKFWPDRPTAFSRSLTDTQKGKVDLTGGSGQCMRFGIRIGNGRHGFNTPVVVAALEDRADFDKRKPVAETVDKLYSRVVVDAPNIIRMAKLTMVSYKYATDPDYKQRMDERFGSPAEAQKRFPILVPNQKYFADEAKYVLAKDAKPRMCRATVMDGLHPVLNRNGDTISVETEDPWMTVSGHAAIQAARDSEYPMRPENIRVANALLKEPVRERGVLPSIIADRDHKTIRNEDLRKSSIKELVRTMDRQFKAADAEAKTSRDITDD